MSRDAAVTIDKSARTVSALYRFILPPSKTLTLGNATDNATDSATKSTGSNDTKSVRGSASAVGYLTYINLLVHTVAVVASAVLLT